MLNKYFYLTLLAAGNVHVRHIPKHLGRRLGGRLIEILVQHGLVHGHQFGPAVVMKVVQVHRGKTVQLDADFGQVLRRTATSADDDDVLGRKDVQPELLLLGVHVEPRHLGTVARGSGGGATVGVGHFTLSGRRDKPVVVGPLLQRVPPGQTYGVERLLLSGG
uniref:(northern house mosquito) hypothetical protein n=1 Tax=Culex pipiens TaxID=7175 RepID=A0A8D8AYX1_CULPI